MSVIEKGFSGVLGEISPERYKYVVTPTDPALAGYVKLVDAEGAPILTTESGALLTSDEGLIFFEQVDGSSVNINLWSQSTASLAIAQASGYISLNSALAITANGYAILTSNKYVPMYGSLPLRIQISAKVAVLPQSNLTMELGIGLVATNAAPTDGAFFRWHPNGNFLAVVNNAGAETASANLSPPPVAGKLTLFEIIIVEDLVRFLINDTIVAEISNSVGIAFPVSGGRLPVFARVYNSASVPAQAPQLSIGQVIVVQQDMKQNKNWGEVLSTMGRGSYQSPVASFAQTSNHTNSTSPTSASLSNTAAGYTTLGGRYQFAALAGAATDYALFAFQVPVGFQLFITNIRITAMNTGAINSVVTPTVMDWAIGLNASAVSLATVDGAGTWAPRRIPLGMQGFGISSALASNAVDISARFEPPLVVDGSRYLHVILQIPFGAATGSQIIRGDVMISGYFE